MGLAEIATFVEAVEQGSIAGAARTLGVPRSTVSRRLTRLEEELGQQLLRRHSRLFHLTEAGELLYRRCVSGVRDVQDAAAYVRDGANAMTGELRITAPQDIGVSIRFVRALAAFRHRWPQVRLSIVVTDRVVDLEAEGLDFAIRPIRGQLRGSASLQARRLGTLRLHAYASPSYLDQQGRPARPEDLLRHCLVLPERLLPENVTFGHADTGEEVTVALRPNIQANSMAFMPAAALAGAGIALLPDIVGQSFAEAGAIERVLEAWAMPTGDLWLLWPRSRLPAPRRRAFLDFFPDALGLEQGDQAPEALSTTR